MRLLIIKYTPKMNVWIFIVGVNLHLYRYGKALLFADICILRIKDRTALVLLCQDLSFVHLKK